MPHVQESYMLKGEGKNTHKRNKQKQNKKPHTRKMV